MPAPVPLLIIGGGAAGLFAGCLAGDRGLGAMILERKHKPGRKLLMCGNGRCNLTKDITPARMLDDMGAPMSDFLSTALNAFPPAAVQAWFQRHNVPLKRMDDRRVFPRSEQASDVVHALTDALRDTGTALCLNTPATGIERHDAGFHVSTAHFSLLAQRVLIATGGVSYPKTGSVGDGQKFAKALGHSLKPYRPGLIGFVVAHPWIAARAGTTLEHAVCRIFHKGRRLYEGHGQLDCEHWGLGGAAAYNASRCVARQNLSDFELEWQVDSERFRVCRPATRPLKEAIVTMGGVPLSEVDPGTMQSRICPGLYFAGEVMDIDGPTGGYNLTAAFATAALAIRALSLSPLSGSCPPQACAPRQVRPAKPGAEGRLRSRRDRAGGHPARL
ncbi:MAG TPA: aminoacetone oxidase family FAD-binding enzyme [Kiritimatiellia bacterium]|nr:aminoacetone oxidase family FAD-binding enzyme [Kiritimatiellia bacterium]